MSEGERSARARFLLPLLWAVKMSDFCFEGRGRPVVVGVEVEVVDEARREERVDVNAALEEWLMVEDLVVRGRGRPYREVLDVIVAGRKGWSDAEDDGEDGGGSLSLE